VLYKRGGGPRSKGKKKKKKKKKGTMHATCAPPRAAKKSPNARLSRKKRPSRRANGKGRIGLTPSTRFSCEPTSRSSGAPLPALKQGPYVRPAPSLRFRTSCTAGQPSTLAKVAQDSSGQKWDPGPVGFLPPILRHRGWLSSAEEENGGCVRIRPGAVLCVRSCQPATHQRGNLVGRV